MSLSELNADARTSSRPRARQAILAASIALGVLFTHPSLTNAEGPTVKIVGLGAATCGQFTNDVGKNPAVQRDYLAWAQGFMSGILIGRPPGVDERLDLLPPSFPLLKQLDFLREHCGRHTSDDFSDAVMMLYKKLRNLDAI